MWGLLIAVLSAFGVMFVAELGDKTQLLALGFGARYGLRTVAIGLTLGYAAAGAVAALVGGVLGAALPERPIGLAAGMLFLVFAALAVRPQDGDDGDDGERLMQHTQRDRLDRLDDRRRGDGRQDAIGDRRSGCAIESGRAPGSEPPPAR